MLSEYIPADQSVAGNPYKAPYKAIIVSIPYYPTLDGLRAVAVLIVLFAHAGLPFLKSGGVGVDIFFVLSGFLITSILFPEARCGKINFLNFYARRMLRLMPCLVLTCLLVLIGTWMLTGELALTPVIAALTYTSNWVRAFSNVSLQGLAHCWSLAIEEQYYLLWPIVVLLLERTSRDNLRNALFLIAVSLVLALYRSVCVGWYSPGRIYFGLDTHMDGLVLGGALAYLIEHVRNTKGLGNFLSKFLSYVLTPIALCGLVCVMWRLTWGNPWMGKIGYPLVAVAAAVLIADLSIGKHSFIQVFFRNRVLVHLGRISYGIYLLHFPLCIAVDQLFSETSVVVRIAIKVNASILLALLSFHFIEVRFLALKRYFQGPPNERQHPTRPPTLVPESSPLTLPGLDR